MEAAVRRRSAALQLLLPIVVAGLALLFVVVVADESPTTTATSVNGTCGKKNNCPLGPHLLGTYVYLPHGPLVVLKP